MSKLRGDDALSSLLDEMSSQQGYDGREKASKQPAKQQGVAVSAAASKKQSHPIRLMPEVKYGYYPRVRDASGHHNNIWNPYIASPVSPSTTSAYRCCWFFAPTNPQVEVFRRRAYERFKLKFQTLFEHIIIVAKNQQPSPTKDDNDAASNLWKELSIPSLLERWHFSTKLEEFWQIRARNEARIINAKSSNYLQPTSYDCTTSTTTGEIRSRLVAGRENGTLMDPVLVSSSTNHNNNNNGKKQQQKSGFLHKSHNVLLSEVKFEWTRAWRRKVGGKTQDDALEDVFSSAKFHRKIGKLSRNVKDLATEMEDMFWKDLAERAGQEAAQQQSIARQHGKKKKKKKTIPKINMEEESVSVTFSGLTFRVHPGHYHKLQILFDRFHHPEEASSSPSNYYRSQHEDAFASALFCLLARYDMLQGAGLQSSLQGAVFDVLLKHFDCRLECFASPLNCRYERYCSAFFDTDKVFGSLGSFFDYDFCLQGGCYQANPPFVADFIQQMYETMDRALLYGGDDDDENSDDQKPLMFVIFVPAWTETEGWKALETSRHSSRHVLLPQASHYYCEGTQHRRKERYRVASFDTSVFFLQNKTARTRWPITDDVVDELRAAFETNPQENAGAAPTLEHGDRSKESVKMELHRSQSQRVEEKQERKSVTTHELCENKPKSTEKDRRSSDVKKSSKQNKKKRKLITEEEGGDNKQQLSILQSLGILGDDKEQEYNPEKVGSTTHKKQKQVGNKFQTKKSRKKKGKS